MNTRRPVMDIHKLCFRYNTQDILQDISLKMYPGFIHAVLGPNGSGKTTLLRLMLGLLKPCSGDIAVCGCSTHAGGSAGLKRVISIVPQTEPVSFELNVEEYVLLGRAPHLSVFRMPGETDRAFARQAIETVGLTRLIHRAVSSLSGGENQLARIARALTQQTAVILLDEPTAHLDLANISNVTGILRRLAADGKTIIFTTNDPNIVSLAADQVFLLKDHRLIAAGALPDVFTETNLRRVYGVDVDVIVRNGRPFALIRPAE